MPVRTVMMLRLEDTSLSLLDLAQLPALDDANTAEETYLRLVLARVRGDAQMIRSTFIEAGVAELLDAKVPATGIAPFDLLVDDAIRVQVKASQPHVAFTLNDWSSADVFVFVVKQPGTDVSSMPVFVLSAADVAAIKQRPIAHSRLARLHEPCSADELPLRVRAAFARTATT